jgi:hypothetical protein
VIRPSKFAPEFKARAIDLYRSSEGPHDRQCGPGLGIDTETFRKWIPVHGQTPPDTLPKVVRGRGNGKAHASAPTQP